MPSHMLGARRFIAITSFIAAPFVVAPLAAQNPTRQPPPPLGTPKAFHLPAKREFALANGMKVTMVPFGKIPKVSVIASIRTGNIDESPSEVWLSNVTGDMMREGTTSLTAAQIAEKAAEIGGDVTVAVGDDETTVGGASLAERGPEMVSLVADVLRHPRFPESELARIKTNRVRRIAVAKQQPGTIASAEFASELYGDHPYGRTFPSDAMLNGYTIEQVRNFYAKNFGAARTHLYIVGVYDAAAMERAARAAFADWARGPAPTVKPPAPKSQKRVTLIDRPNAVQSTLILGLPVPGPQSKDYDALEVTDAILGGTFGSRITTNIREQKGYTYSPFSFIDTHYHDAYWAEQADVTTAVTGASLKEIYAEIDRLTREAPPATELDGVKNNMIGLFTIRNASRAGIVNMLQFADEQGLGDAYLTGYVKRISAITPAEVQRVMKTYLRPEKMTLVVVGDKKTVEPQLAPFQTVVP